MKKLFFSLLLLAAVGASAQENVPEKLFGGETPQRTSVSLVGGPNWQVQYSAELGDGNYESRTGYTLGIDLARRMLSERWQLKLGVRYNVWRFAYESHLLVWPSELVTGTYIFDPSLSHYIRENTTEKAWQYFAGVRWLLGRPKHWRWYAEAEVGTIELVNNSIRDGVRFNAGLSAGLQWKPKSSKHFVVFAQPGARYIFPVEKYTFKFLPLQVEMGARYEW
jgi:hypothetical protein